MDEIDNLTLILIGMFAGVLLALSAVSITIGNLISRKDNCNGSHR